MLSTEIATNLRGRCWTEEIFPFNFREMLGSKNVTLEKPFVGQTKLRIMHHLKSFLQDGGFPEVIDVSRELHRTALQGYIHTVIYRDVVERHNIHNIQALRHLVNHCLRNSATTVSINKIYNFLKSIGCEVGKNSLYEFMDYLEDAYCIFSVPKYNLLLKTSDSMKKIFPVDQGLITAVTMASQFDLAAQLETAVFAHMRRLTRDIFYYRSVADKEVDFVIILPDQTMKLYQVCLNLQEPKTRSREINSLSTAMRELSLDEGTIVTFDEQEDIVVDEGTIKIVPIWKLLLE
jgi:predicted AAA+ superfamily ATPase